MNCAKCNNQLPSDAKFCNHCGNPNEFKSTNKVMEKMGNHLEFLGYKIEWIKPSKDGGKDIMTAIHAQHNNVLLFELTPNLVMLRIALTTKKQQSNDEMNRYFNDNNKSLNCSRAFYEIEDGIVVLKFESVYTGDYNKEVFGQFFEFFNNDVNIFFKGKDFDRIFIS